MKGTRSFWALFAIAFWIFAAFCLTTQGNPGDTNYQPPNYFSAAVYALIGWLIWKKEA